MIKQGRYTDTLSVQTESAPTVSNTLAPDVALPSSISAPVLPVAGALGHPDHTEDQERETPVMLVDPVGEPAMVTIRVSGLKPKILATEMGWTECSRVLRVSGDTKFGDLNRILHREAPGTSGSRRRGLTPD